jgi:flagellar motor switch protein FliN/FliY
MSVESIVEMKVGTIVEFDVPFDAELTLLVADQPIAKGHAVKVGENFGVRLSSVLSVEGRIQRLGRK